jgi:hypothetical protein
LDAAEEYFRMSDNLTDALALLMDRLEHSMKAPPESGATLPSKQVAEMLEWLHITSMSAIQPSRTF